MKKQSPITAAHCRKVLKDMVVIINESGMAHQQYANAFRDIVTALRGPDNEDLVVKVVTTARIRHAIGIKNQSSGLIVQEGDICIAAPGDPYSHFEDHVRRAHNGLMVLGLLKQGGTK